jgi:predicted nucleic acid-binding protein
LQRLALIDSNVVIASIFPDHDHHNASRSLLIGATGAGFAIAAHSCAESFNILTRQGGAFAYGYPPNLTIEAINRLASSLEVLSLSSYQMLDAIRHYAASGGIGPRLYDYLIGYVAVVHAIPSIITWNVKHMAPLFPASDVVTPAQFISAVGQ